jgi:hypothetical protein
MPRFKFLLVKGLIFGTVIQIVLTCGFCLPIWANDFQPDPLSVQHLNPAYRYPQAGWNVVHIEGRSYDRGIQHGKLLAPEIAAYVRALAAFYEPKSPTTAWQLFRKLANSLFLRGYNQEQLLIGRPDNNMLVKRFQNILPVTFGARSFAIRGMAYAHPKSAVVMAAENPYNRRYSVVTIAGLSSSSTLRVVSQFEGEALSYAQVVLLPHDRDELDLVSPPKALVYPIEN